MKPSKLENAIRAGDLDQVRKLIAGGADVSAAFADGTKPILLAAREGQVTILRALAAAGADLEDLDSLSFPERLKLFVDSSLDPQGDDDLMSAEELSEWALQAVGERMDDKLASEISAYEGPVFRAVRTGDVELLKERIAAGDDLERVFEVTRDTALTQALQKGNEEMVRELIQAGANVNHVGYSTPLAFALPDLALAKLLIEADADVYVRGLDGMSPLARAVHRALYPSSSRDSALLVRFFLEAGVHPPLAETGAGTLLMEAEHRQAWELYQELLPHYPEEIARESFEELRFHQDLEDVDGGFLKWTFDLKYAAQHGELEELRELLAKRHEDFAEEAGQALVEAVRHVQLEAARVLIEAGADLGAAERHEKRRGSTALAAAAESWHRKSSEAMRLLLDAGADVDQRGACGRTPLMYAVLVAYRHGAALRKAVPLLLEAGADPNLEDEFGLTAWTLAKAPLIEAEERSRAADAGAAVAVSEPFFDGPDLADLFSERANAVDRRRGRLDRCREALELLEAAGAAARGEAELRLVLAAAAGDAGRVDELLAAGASAAARGLDGTFALLAAARTGRSDVVARLIAAAPEAGVELPGSTEALAVAVQNADEAMTRLLIDAGANVVMMTLSTDRPLAAAEAAGATAVVEMVRACLPPKLVDLDRRVESEIAAEDLTYESQRELPRQAAAGELEKVRELLAVDGVEVDGFDDLRRTALLAAAEAGRSEMVRELIAAGADVNLSNGIVGSPRSTPLSCAAVCPSAERDQVLALLLAAGADPDQLGGDGRTALMHAVERDVGFFGRTGEFALSTRTLIAAGADLEIRDPFGLTAWMRAMSLASSIDIDEVSRQYEAVARLLEEAGAATAGGREVELVAAVTDGDVERARQLLAAGADPNARRHDGATALILAVLDGEREIVRLLIEAGCDLDAREWVERGRTALESAVESRNHQMLRLL